MLPALVPGIWRAVACVASKGRAENLEPLGLGFGIQEALMGIHFSTTSPPMTIYGLGENSSDLSPKRGYHH